MLINLHLKFRIGFIARFFNFDDVEINSIAGKQKIDVSFLNLPSCSSFVFKGPIYVGVYASVDGKPSGAPIAQASVAKLDYQQSK